MSDKKIVILGAGSFGQQILQHIIEKQNNSKVIGWIDDYVELGAPICDLPCLSNIENFIAKKNTYTIIIALGYKNLKFKETILQTLLKKEFNISGFIHKSVIMSNSCQIGLGSIILAGTILDINSKIGIGVVLNNGVIVSHDSKIDDSTFIGPGVTICGNVSIGKRCFIGAGSIIKDGVTIASDVTIGSGSSIFKNIDNPGIYIQKGKDICNIRS